MAEKAHSGKASPQRGKGAEVAEFSELTNLCVLCPSAPLLLCGKSDSQPASDERNTRAGPRKAKHPAAGFRHRLEGGMHIVEHDHGRSEVRDGGIERECLGREAGRDGLDAVGDAAGEALQGEVVAAGAVREAGDEQCVGEVVVNIHRHAREAFARCVKGIGREEVFARLEPVRSIAACHDALRNAEAIERVCLLIERHHEVGIVRGGDVQVAVPRQGWGGGERGKLRRERGRIGAKVVQRIHHIRVIRFHRSPHARGGEVHQLRKLLREVSELWFANRRSSGRRIVEVSSYPTQEMNCLFTKALQL